MIKKLASLALLLFTFISFQGCSKESPLQYFNKDGYFERTMDNLRTGTMVQGLETKAIIHAIYLNRVDAKLYSDGEYFF
ncbi:MAG: hypothetical protein OEW60_06055, partial [Thiovulaceae bacterium]|nr:hypothetical protein [Sulfurimonadaceae bacterium]